VSEALLAKGRRVCLHAAPSFDGRDRRRLGRQLAYMLRPPVALHNVQQCFKILLKTSHILLCNDRVARGASLPVRT
jgi:hypothetical protein